MADSKRKIKTHSVYHIENGCGEASSIDLGHH